MNEVILLDITGLLFDIMVLYKEEGVEEINKHLPSVHDSITAVEVTFFIFVNLEDVGRLELFMGIKELTDKPQASPWHELASVVVLVVNSERDIIDSFVLSVIDVVQIPPKHELFLLIEEGDISIEENCVFDLITVHVSSEHPAEAVVEVVEVVEASVILHSPFEHNSIEITLVCFLVIVVVADSNLNLGTSTMDDLLLVEVTVMVEVYAFLVDDTKLIVVEEENMHWCLEHDSIEMVFVDVTGHHVVTTITKPSLVVVKVECKDVVMILVLTVKDFFLAKEDDEDNIVKADPVETVVTFVFDVVFGEKGSSITWVDSTLDDNLSEASTWPVFVVTLDKGDKVMCLKLWIFSWAVAVNGHQVVYRVTIPLEVVVIVNTE